MNPHPPSADATGPSLSRSVGERVSPYVGKAMARSEHVPSYYTATAHPAPDQPQLAGEVRTDVVVIGAGYTGISAALELAQRGYDVVVLEAERVGWGASGRNGGQVCTGFSASLGKIEKQVGLEDRKSVV